MGGRRLAVQSEQPPPLIEEPREPSRAASRWRAPGAGQAPLAAAIAACSAASRVTPSARATRARGLYLDLADEPLVQPVRHDHHRPAGQLLPAALIVLCAHALFSCRPGRRVRPGRRPGCPTRSTSRRSSSRCRSPAGTSARTRCGSSARRCGSRRWSACSQVTPLPRRALSSSEALNVPSSFTALAQGMLFAPGMWPPRWQVSVRPGGARILPVNSSGCARRPGPWCGSPRRP